VAGCGSAQGESFNKKKLVKGRWVHPNPRVKNGENLKGEKKQLGPGENLSFRDPRARATPTTTARKSEKKWGFSLQRLKKVTRSKKR